MAAPFLVSVASGIPSDDQKRSVASPSVRAHGGLIKAPAKREERGPLPGRSDGRLFHD